MKIPNLTIQQLLEAGVHLGHKTLRWNPKMKPYIFGSKNAVHIIDLTQTIELINTGLVKVYEIIKNGGHILFVSTKKQASESIANLAKDTSQFFVNYRWLGGMLTNWGTISNSIKKLEKINGSKIKVAISTGDSNSTDNKLDDADVIILTNETMDAMMTFQKSWIYEIGLVVSDEIHLIGDSGRGPTLEMILTRLKTGYVGKKPQIVGLSATISNSSLL